MKKGFTMIELVFVIVILGILASLAVPKLAATRDDAEAAKAAVEIKDAITQLTTYYIVNGSFGTKDLTNKDMNATVSPTIVEVRDSKTKTADNKWTNCVTLTASDGDAAKSIPANIKVTAGDVNSSFCSAVRGTQAYKDWSTMTNGIQVGGSGIFK